MPGVAFSILDVDCLASRLLLWQRWLLGAPIQTSASLTFAEISSDITVPWSEIWDT